MRHKLLVPVAGLTVVLLTGLTGCGLGGTPAPTPSASDTATSTPSVTPTPEPTEDPTTVTALPGSALLRLSVTAASGDQEVRLVLTVARASTMTSAPSSVADVQEACPNAIQSQLESFPGYEPVGVLRSTLTATGDWPEGLTVAIAGGGLIATIGDGDDVDPADDPVDGFGCAVAILTGPGDATFTSLLIGDPAVVARDSLELQVAHGHYGFESDSGPVTWKNCVVQLSSAAQRYATENSWPAAGPVRRRLPDRRGRNGLTGLSARERTRRNPSRGSPRFRPGRPSLRS